MRCLVGVAALALATVFPTSAHAEWTRTYIVEWNEPAMHYGAKDGVTEPGADCPKGSNPEVDWKSVMVKAGYTPVEARWMFDPANPTRVPNVGQNQMAYRGADRANVYTNPTSTPDPKMVGVTGKIGEGLDLDGNARNGFTDLSGRTGLDNEFYRALGCWKTYRGPRRLSSSALQFNDAMRNGRYSQVIVVHGAGDDPMNDKNVSVGLYMSDDKIVKDANGGVAADYTFRIAPHARYEAIWKAKTENGRITSTDTSDIQLRDAGYMQDLELLKSRIDFTMEKDGSLKGHMGGYRPWEPLYKGWVNGRGPIIEMLTWVELPGVYYALRRHADFAPTPGGEKTHISYAARIDALPAFVMTPDGSAAASQVVSYKDKADRATLQAQVLRVYNQGGIIGTISGPKAAGPNAALNVPDGYGEKAAP